MIDIALYTRLDKDYSSPGMSFILSEVTCLLCIKEVYCMCINWCSLHTGLQSDIWSETIRSVDHLHSMLFPRMLAMAERGWHQAPWEVEVNLTKRTTLRNDDWRDWVNTLRYKELLRLEKIGVGYYLPLPGTK